MERASPSEVRIPRWRRITGILVLTGLALLLGARAVAADPLARALCLALAVAAVWAVGALWRARQDRLVWDARGLTDGSGRRLAARALITGIDTGAVALRPSQGFTLQLSQPVARGWSPGLWWSTGRTVGVGGLVDRRAVRAMAQRIAADLAADADPEEDARDG